MKILVVFYSRTGHTRQIAHEIADRSKAELEEIREERSREGFLGYWRSAWQVLTRAEAPIRPMSKALSDYDLVVVGTPVWIQRPAPPVTTFLRQNRSRLRRLAFFCTEGGRGESRAFEAMRQCCDNPPMATRVVTERQMPIELHAERLNDFVARISG